MKASKYIYYIPYKDNIIVFNGVNNSFFIINQDMIDVLMKMMATPNLFDYNQLKTLRDRGFILDDSVDELSVITHYRDLEINNPTYTLMLLPTYCCNFSCWYCVQKHKDEFMDKDLENKVMNHIRKYVEDNKIKTLELSWFGGEPILAFNSSIIRISEYAINYCSENGIDFVNSITTNAFLITDAILAEMKRLHFSSFQITIDGDRAIHDKVKHSDSGTSSFDTTVSNIVKIVSKLADATLTLRFNYTALNMHPELIVSQLNELIPIEYRKRITILPRKVWQEKEETINRDDLLLFKQLIYNSGYFFLESNIRKEFIACYVERKNFNAIFQNGKVDKCSNGSPDDALGELMDDGSIYWKKKTSFTFMTKCIKCKFLPFCLGGCPKARESIVSGSVNCINEADMFQLIIDYCEYYIVEANYEKQ